MALWNEVVDFIGNLCAVKKSSRHVKNAVLSIFVVELFVGVITKNYFAKT